MFQAKLDYTKEEMLAYYRFDKRTHRKLSRVLAVVACVFMIFSLLVQLLLLVRYGEMIYLVYAICVAVLLALLLSLDRITSRSILKSVQATGASLACFEEDGVSVSTARIQSRYLYTGLSELFYSRADRCYYLYLNKRMALVFPERYFTEGDPSAFGAFIEQKTGLKLKEIK